jgi:hypothetical protein
VEFLPDIVELRFAGVLERGVVENFGGKGELDLFVACEVGDD